MTDAVGERAVALARELLRCPSITPSEAGSLGVIETALKGLGFAVHRVTFAEPGTQPVENLYARIGTTSPHFVFAGHSDVVPPGDEGKWRHRPFAADMVEGNLYGRGAVDMKGAIACAIAATRHYLQSRNGRLEGSLSFLITGDEEGVAVNGTVKLLRWAVERGEKFDHCLLGEPSNAQRIGDTIKVGRRGSLNGTLIVTGRQGHVAYPERADNPVRGLLTIMNALLAISLDQGSALFTPSNLEFTSVDVGNSVVNLIPGEARGRFNIRFNDCHSQVSLKTLIERCAAQAAGNRVHWRIEWQPSNADSFVLKPDSFLDLVRAAIKQVTGAEPQLSTTGGTSDARFIKDYCPVLEFGLVGQSMHQIDEHTPIADLHRLTEIYKKILERYFERVTA